MPEELSIPPKMEVSALAEHFPLLNPKTKANARAILDTNLGPRGVSEKKLDRIKVPSGDNQMWTLDGLEGKEAFKELSGVILAWRDARLYWNIPFAERGKKTGPPDCMSTDGFIGIGDPGGSCPACPLAQWGSDPKGGRGQACKQVMQVLFLRSDIILPDLLTIPPTSYLNADKYFQRLAGHMIPCWGLVTNLRLEPIKNADGISYSRILFSAGARFNEAERSALEPFQQEMTQLLRNTKVDADEAPGTDDDFTPPRGQYSSPIDD
jgi:hypothetical protein